VLPSAATVAVSVWSTTPSPLASRAIVSVLRSALTVVTALACSAPLALVSVTVEVALPSAFNAVTLVSVRSKTGLPLPSTAPVVSSCVVFTSPLALVVMTVSPSSVPLALRSVTVSVALPSGFSTVTSEIVRVKPPDPVASSCVVLLSPLALVVTTLRPIMVPLTLPVSVSVVLPSGSAP